MKRAFALCIAASITFALTAMAMAAPPDPSELLFSEFTLSTDFDGALTFNAVPVEAEFALILPTAVLSDSSPSSTSVDPSVFCVLLGSGPSACFPQDVGRMPVPV